MQGVVGVISRIAPDVLCHAAVRARNSSVLLAACSDADEVAGIAGWHDQQVQAQLTKVGLGQSVASTMCNHAEDSATLLNRVEDLSLPSFS